LKKKIFSIFFVLVLVCSFSLVTAVPVGAVVPTVPDRETAILAAADRLVETQNTDGGFDWVFDDNPASDSATNCLGITAMGILKAHELEDKATYETALAKAYGYAKVNTARYVYPDVTYLVWLADAAAADASLLDAIIAEVPGTTIQDIRTLAESIWTTRMAGGPYGTDGLGLDAAGRAVKELEARATAGYGGLGFWDLEAAVKAALALGLDADAQAIAGVMYANLQSGAPYYFDITDTSTICYVLALSGTIEAFLEVGVYPTMARTMTDQLIAFQDEAGYWDEVAAPMWYESVQSTAYAVMALVAQDDPDALVAAQSGSDWLVGRQTVDGGWNPIEKDYFVENLEVNSEVAWALATAEAPVTIGDLGYYSIQSAIDSASSGNTISVAAGTYDPFTVDGKTGLTIQSSSVVTVQGVQVVTTAYGDRDAVVFVTDSTNIVLDDLNIQGQGLGTINAKNYGVIYENSSGEIKDCTVSPNTIGDMASMAIGIWDGSDVDVKSCTVENFGRIGVFIYNGCTVEVLDSTIEGQVYSGEGEVCYGIEVEALDATPATASQATIRGNEIYNCDNTFEPEPSWQSGGVYINGWLEYQPEADSTVIVENNDIHDNYSGIIVIKSPSSYAHFNNIYDNRAFGVESLPAHDASTAVFDATCNWWGHSSGPSHSPGSGDPVSDDVLYEPWLFESVVPGEEPVTYEKTLALNPGWSIVSPDKELASYAVADSVVVLTYDNGGWTENFVLDAITPVFIKTDTGGGGIGFNYAEASQGIFATGLEAGWNLIGIPLTFATTGAILSPLRFGEGNEVALATLANQSHFNTSNVPSFYLAMLSETDWTNLPLLSPFDGYWAYMNVDKEFGVIVVPGPGGGN